MHNPSFPQPGTPGAQSQPPASLPQANTPPAVVPVTLPAPQQPVVDAQATAPNLLHPIAMTAQAQQPASVSAAPLLGAAAGSKRNGPDSGSDQQMNEHGAGGSGLPPDGMPVPSMPLFAGAGIFLPYNHGYGGFNQGGFNQGLPAPGYDINALSFHGGNLFGPQGDLQAQGLHAPLPCSRDKGPQDKFILAAARGDKTGVLALLSHGIDANSRTDGDSGGMTALMLAAESGHKAIVQILLAVPGIDIHAKDCDGYTALLFAIDKWQDQIERMILAALDENTDTKGKSANAALISAVVREDELAVRALLANPDIDINSNEEFGLTALHVAASLGNQAIIRSLLAKPGIDVNATDAAGRTALIRAVKKGHEAIVRELLDMPGIDVNVYYDEEYESSSALILAAENGHGAIARALLAGPAFHLYSIHQALYVAAMGGHQAIVEALLAMPGIVVNSCSDSVLSTLIHALVEGNETIVKVLLAMPGIDINFLKISGLQTPLMCAADKGNEAIVEALLAVPDIDVNAVDSLGSTALLWAVKKSQERVVRILLAQPGIRIDVADKEGNTAFSIAKRDGHDAITQMLRNHVPASLTEPSTVLDLLQTIFTIHSGETQQSASSSADIALNRESARKLDKLCESLQFGTCPAADVPALFSPAGSLPGSAQSALALSLAFGFCTGHYRNAAGALDDAIAIAIDKAGLHAAFTDALNKLSLAAKHINLFHVDQMNLLGIAAKAGNERMIRGLVRLGAYVNLPSPNGKTALAIAVENRQWGACAELVSHGALPTLPIHGGYPALYHIVQDFCADEHSSPALASLIRYLRIKGVPFDIPVKNPDDSMREAYPMVPLYELLASNAQSWISYGHIVYGLKNDAPPTGPAPANTTATTVNLANSV